jgi:hypothetical protein
MGDEQAAHLALLDHVGRLPAGWQARTAMAQGKVTTSMQTGLVMMLKGCCASMQTYASY